VSGGALHIRFEDEQGLAELVESLEVATSRLADQRAA
jgi:hypothetical protein